jgi:hypothetical protein
MAALSRRSTAQPLRLRAAVLFCALAAFGGGGCASGDFGRTRSTFVTDDMHAWLGPEATGSLGEPSSLFPLTDGERQLRDLAYPFIEPPRDRPFWAGVFGDYLPISPPWGQKVSFDRTAYGRRLLADPTRSATTRYSQLIEDIRDDITRIEQFAPVAARVIDLDGKRHASLAYVSQPSANEIQDAKARMRENALIVKWVQICEQQRIASYRWALERLVIATPDPLAVQAEQVLDQLVQRTSGAAIAVKPAVEQVVSVKG